MLVIHIANPGSCWELSYYLLSVSNRQQIDDKVGRSLLSRCLDVLSCHLARVSLLSCSCHAHFLWPRLASILLASRFYLTAKNDTQGFTAAHFGNLQIPFSHKIQSQIKKCQEKRESYYGSSTVRTGGSCLGTHDYDT